MAPFPTSKRQKIKERAQTWEQLLLAPPDATEGVVDMDALRQLAKGGVPDHPPLLRIRAWRLLLGLTSAEDRGSWDEEVQRKRDEYATLRDMLVQRAVQQPLVDRHMPLSNDDQRLNQIDADARRTQAMLAFFSAPIRDLETGDLERRLDRLNPDRAPHDRRQSVISSRSSPSSPSSPVFSPTLTQSTEGTDRTSLVSNLGLSRLETAFPKLHLTSPSPIEAKRAVSPLSLDSDPEEVFKTPSSGSPPSLHSSPPREPRQPLRSPQPRPFTYRDALTRLLVVYASLNPGVGFIQGMADLAAVMLFVFGNASADSEASDAEADAFWAFQALMSHVRDVFVRALDGTIDSVDPSSPASWASIGRSRPLEHGASSSQTGIGALLRRFSETLRWLDPKLANHLRVEGVEPHFYAFRWITCLCSQEFSLPDVIRLWDTFLALASGAAEGNSSALDFATDFCCVLVLCQRERLMSTGFAGCLGALQRVGHELPLDPAASQGGIDALCARALDIYQRRTARDAANATPKSSPQKSAPMPSPGDGIDREVWLGGEDGEEREEVDGASTWDSMQKLAARWAPAEKSKRMSVESEVSNGSVATSGGLFERYKGAVKSRTEAWRDTDAAAALSKKATNWSIAASNWRTQAPVTLAKLQAPINLGENLSTKWSRGGLDPPPSPPDAPFSPPSTSSIAFGSNGTGSGRSSPSLRSSPLLDSQTVTPNGSFGMQKRGSTGPKPLLLSRSARPAGSVDSASPSSSRRSSWLEGPPVSQTSRSVSPITRTRSPIGRASLPVDGADRPIPVLGRVQVSSTNGFPTPSSAVSEGTPRRLGLGKPPVRSYPREPRRHFSESAPSTTTTGAAKPRRGWTLTDAPASPPLPDDEPAVLIESPGATPVQRGSSWKLSHRRDVSDASEASAHADDYEPPPSAKAFPSIPIPPMPANDHKPRVSSLPAKIDLARLDGVPTSPTKSSLPTSPTKSTLPTSPTASDFPARSEGKLKGLKRLVAKRRISAEERRSWDEEELLSAYR